MGFYEVLERVQELLRHRGRVTYRALKREFDLDDAFIEDLKAELIDAQHLAVDENGNVLVWTGATGTTSAPVSPPSSSDQPPAIQEDQPTHHVTSPQDEPRTPHAERRQLTVMFCDLVGSTALSAQLDPEDLREVVRTYQATCATIIHRFEGYIAQYLGDGLLIYFSYPLAHEDDARRAVRAGLEIVEAIGALNIRLEGDQGIQLAVRLGIHTGLVVVGEVGGRGRQEQLALGETPNIAARLQGLAEPDTVVVSEATHRLAEGFFTWQALGTQRLRGVSQPMSIYRVLQESGAQTRLDTAPPSGLTPLVGRESEVTLLLERWAQVLDGLGQMVLLSGEAGIGKSRLVEALTERVVREGAVRIAFRCSPYHTNSALHPVIAHLERLLQFHPDDAPAQKLDKLERVLQAYNLPLQDVVPLFAALLSVSLAGRYLPLSLSPQKQKQQMQEALIAWLLEEAERQPVLVVWEDLHWADPSTFEVLQLFMEQTPTTRILTLATCRPSFRPPWTPRTYLAQLTLNRLTRIQVEEMVLRVTGGKPLPADVVQHIVAKTDGVPLFVEELTKMVLESGLLREAGGQYKLSGPLSSLAIPTTLHDSLMARLDRLAEAKAVAQLGATIGRQFAYELLRAVSLLDERGLWRSLAQLVEAELLYQRGMPPQATYTFKHALIQEAAYQSLLKSTRQQYHQRLAQALAERFPDTAQTQPELLAHHATEAGLSRQAIDYWYQAGQRAIERSANAEAIGHLTKGLELLQTLPDTPERAQRELDLQVALGPALMATKGLAAPEVEHAYTRARALCHQVGETPQLFPVLVGLCTFYRQRGALQTARQVGEQCLALAQRAEEPALLLEAHRALGVPLFYLGELALSRFHLEQGNALYDLQQYRSHVFRYGLDPGVNCLLVAWPLWLLGYSDQALERSREALTLAQELSHPYSLAYALQSAMRLHRFRREEQTAREQAEALVTLSNQQGFTQWAAGGTIMCGWALTVQGQGETGLAQMHHGLTAWRAMGIEAGLPYWLAMLAEAYGSTGQVEAGRRVLTEALTLVDTTEERWWEAELHRLKGELLLALSTDNAAQAEACFHQALDITRRQQAKSLELRAALSLSRLWQSQSKRAEAYQLLAEIYGWFTEGFDTADLQEAKALLAELFSASQTVPPA